MPFAGYQDFEDCVRQNQDKDSPEGFCAWLHYQITGKFPSEKGVGEKLREYAFKSNPNLALKDIQYIIDAWEDWAGSWTDCVEALRGKPGIDDPESLCAWLHYQAEGKYPGEKSKGGVYLSAPFVLKNHTLKVATAPVLVPGEEDSDGEVVSAEKIEEVALKWMEEYQLVDVIHSFNKVAVPVESWITRTDIACKTFDGEAITLPKGTWMLSVRIKDDSVWDRVVKGELTGFSIAGVRKADLQGALKSKDPGKELELALKRKILLKDLGEDWVAVSVSIVSDPAVFKSKWIALKSASGNDNRDKSKWWWWNWFTKKSMNPNVENERGGRKMTNEEIKMVVREELVNFTRDLKKLAELEKLAEKEANPQPEPSPPASPSLSEKDWQALAELKEAGLNEEQVKELASQMTPEAFKSIMEKVQNLEEKVKKITSAPRGDEVAEKSQGEESVGIKRDAFGRRIR